MSDRTPIVTVAAEHGAGGDLVAPRVADALGVPFLDRALPASLAAASEESERPGRLVGSLARVSTMLAGEPVERMDLTEGHIRAELAGFLASHLRTLRDGLSELGRTRTASPRVARRSAVWRSQIAPVVRETEDAGRLDLLGGSCLTLTRTAMATDKACRRRLAPRVHELADALAGVAGTPGDRSSRQKAADEALEVARRLATGDMPTDAEAIAAIVALRTAATDLMVFAGVDAEDADAAVREGTGEFRVAAPPSSPRAPFGLRRPTR